MFKKRGLFVILSLIMFNLELFSEEYQHLDLILKSSFEVLHEHRLGLWYQKGYNNNNDNLVFTTGFDFTPISMNFHIKTKYEFPKTNFYIGSGYQGGTGWPLLPYGNGEGMQSNVYDSNIITNVYAQEFMQKAYYRFSLNGGLVFNFGIGNNNNIILRSFQEIYYQYFRGAMHDNHTWMYENIPDRMKNLRYYANYFIGINTPLILNEFGLFVETDLDVYHYNMSTIASGGWGSDWMQINISFVQKWNIAESFTLKSGILWRNDRLYQPGLGENLNLWDRKILSPTVYEFWHIYRVYAELSYRIF